MYDGGVRAYRFSWRNSLFFKSTLILLAAFLGFFLILTLLHLWNFRSLGKDLNRREIERLEKGVSFVLNKEKWGVKNLLQSILWNEELHVRVQNDDLPWLRAALTGEMTSPFASAGVIDNRGNSLYAKRPIFRQDDLQDLISFLREGRGKEEISTFYWRHKGSVYLVGVGSLTPGEHSGGQGWLYLAKELNKAYLVGLRHFSEGEIEIAHQSGNKRSLALRNWRKKPVAWLSIRPSPYFVSLFMAVERVYLWHSLFILLVFALTMTLFSMRLRERIVREFNKIINAFERIHRGEYPQEQLFVKSEDEFGIFAQQIQKASQTISQLLTTDPLTKIYNRTHFYRRLREEVHRAQRYNRPLSLIILDLDNFKRVNDELGHQAGDQLLKDVASGLNETLRTSDILARWGGEEFAIILPETKAKMAVEVAERLRMIIESLSLDDHEQRVGCTASLGIAVLRAREEEENLIRRADQMLYRAKENGRNQVAISPEEA